LPVHGTGCTGAVVAGVEEQIGEEAEIGQLGGGGGGGKDQPPMLHSAGLGALLKPALARRLLTTNSSTLPGTAIWIPIQAPKRWGSNLSVGLKQANTSWLGPIPRPERAGAGRGMEGWPPLVF